ncbi:MAG: 16S rRNA (uracil(1498)-N(3))-methyltransferase [Bacteroidia bacterium]|nr:16S rRNA (uracil(1498)-N(3))-methyltransferase [Bacteroidia bacterium]
MHLFYTPDLQDDTYRLSEEESKHCVRVLRLTEGETLFLVDGKGLFCEAVIISAHPKACILKVVDRKYNYGKRDYELTVGVSPTKNIDRYEWFLEKATEIGIDGIIPLISRYSERKEIKPERLEKVMISAIKQSIKAYLPVLNPIQTFKETIKKPFSGLRFIAHCNEGGKVLLRNAVVKGKNVLILIGPEGDFSTEEVELAVKEGFIPVSLGDSRLRTETAALVACHTVNLINQ